MTNWPPKIDSELLHPETHENPLDEPKNPIVLSVKLTEHKTNERALKGHVKTCFAENGPKISKGDMACLKLEKSTVDSSHTSGALHRHETRSDTGDGMTAHFDPITHDARNNCPAHHEYPGTTDDPYHANNVTRKYNEHSKYGPGNEPTTMPELS